MKPTLSLDNLKTRASTHFDVGVCGCVCVRVLSSVKACPKCFCLVCNVQYQDCCQWTGLYGHYRAQKKYMFKYHLQRKQDAEDFQEEVEMGMRQENDRLFKGMSIYIYVCVCVCVYICM